MSVRTQKLRRWSSFGHRSELPFTFGFLRGVHFVHDTSIVNFWHTTFECFWRLHFVPILTCWMNVFKFKNLANMCIESHRFLCNPYRSWEFHDSIKYQCPGVTVPNGRRFWRALIYIHSIVESMAKRKSLYAEVSIPFESFCKKKEHMSIVTIISHLNHGHHTTVYQQKRNPQKIGNIDPL